MRNPTEEEIIELRKSEEKVADASSDFEWAKSKLKRTFENLKKECGIDRGAMLDSMTRTKWVAAFQTQDGKAVEKLLVREEEVEGDIPDEPTKSNKKVALKGL
jgi:hypothetical protein